MLTAGLVLVACGGSDASGSSGSSHASSRIESACDLLTRSEVIGIMGTDVYGGEQDTDRTIPGTFCEWTSTDYVGEEHENPEYAIFIDEASTDDARESFDNRDDAKQRETVRSLGDGANFYIKGTAEVPFLELRVDDRVMTVGVSGNDLHPVSRDEAKRLERAAAELMVKRLRPTA
jgi:hypothetical protein